MSERDDAAGALAASFLQSPPWAEFQRALGRRSGSDEGDGWSWSAFVERRRGVAFVYCPGGPVVRRAERLRPALRSLTDFARSEGAIFLRVEPRGGDVDAAVLRGARCRPVRAVQPPMTHAVDLRRDEEALRGALARGHRSRVNSAEKRGVHIRESRDPEDVRHFLGLIHAASERKRFRAHTDHHFRVLARTLMPSGTARLYLGGTDEQPVIAASIVIDWNGVRTYAHAAADVDANRRTPTSPPLVWRMLLDARETGMSWFDLFGVAPADDPDHPWAGFSAFKRGFGGVDVAWPGTWELPLRAAPYAAYRALQRIRG